ncbi:MAG: hypothetical protein M3R17_04685 [Bacteroidota bacterium]|nr:hypothetical protein [Bacteroidota bacterium]
MNIHLMKPGKIFFSAVIFATTFFVACAPEEEPAPADARDLYVDSWTLNENSTQIGVSPPYTIHINKVTTNTTQVEIENFYNIGFNFKAKVNIDGSSMTIPQQTYNGNQLHGSGTKTNANSINMTYYVNNGSTIDTCTATLTRQ